jgi:hypothetical protein
MHRALTLALTMVVLILGALVIVVNPMQPTAIVFGMFMISMAILMISIQVYFPPMSDQTVELKVVEEPPTFTFAPVKPVNRPRKVKRSKRSKKIAKKRKTSVKRKRR